MGSDDELPGGEEQQESESEASESDSESSEDSPPATGESFSAIIRVSELKETGLL